MKWGKELLLRLSARRNGGEIRDKILWMQMYYSWEAVCVKQ